MRSRRRSIFRTATLLVVGSVAPLSLGGGAGCGHSNFDFFSDLGAPSPPGGLSGAPSIGGSNFLPGSGGRAGGGFPSFGGAGGSLAGSASMGGEGGLPECGTPGAGPICQPPELRCCSELSFTCFPFDLRCTHCSAPNQCPPGWLCDAATEQCSPVCEGGIPCPGYAPHCEVSTGLCVHCLDDSHCILPDSGCVDGECVRCKQCE